MSKGNGVSSHTHTQQQIDHYANQHNPTSHEYKAERDNHSNQLNPNNNEHHGNNDQK